MTSTNGIPYGRHNITEEDVKAVSEILSSQWLTTGPAVKNFEDLLAEKIGLKTITVSSGTAALHSAYAAIGISPGDEVITPPLTFIATQATAALLGANVRFADIQEDTGNIDPKRVAETITTRTKAIVAVDYAGHPADLDELRELSTTHGIYLIEDAAHSLGSTYKGRMVGSIADLTTFSFFPTKNMTTGEGGAVSSISPELLKRAERFSRQGLVRNSEDFLLRDEGPWHQEVQQFGLNYRLPDILCALGISQVSRLDYFKSERTRVFNEYLKALSDITEVRLPTQRNYVETNWHLFPIRVPKSARLALFNHLRGHGILVQVNYLPAHLHPVFGQTYSRGQFPVSEEFYAQEISLPMFVDSKVFTEEYFARIARIIKEFFHSSKIGG